MKFQSKFLLVISSIILFAATAYTHPTYTGYSGAPGSKGHCASSCHGILGGTIEISGFLSEYIPGQTYTIGISHNGGESIKQFNTSCRIGTGSENAGIIEGGTNTVTYDMLLETNGVHLSSNDQDNGTFLWTAPSEGVGEVRLHVAGHQGLKTSYNTNLVLVATEIASDVFEDLNQKLPTGYNLSDNYPNPFNASTVIYYSLAERSEVTVEIYNILGRKVETLIQGGQKPVLIN